MSAASWCSGRSRAAPACIRIPFGKGVCGVAAADARRSSGSTTSTPSPATSPATAPRTARSGRAARARRRAARRARPRQPEAWRGSTPRMRQGCVQARRKSSPRAALAQACSSRSSLSEPGMIITGQGNLPASLPVKLADQRPGIAAGAAPSTSAAMSSRVPIRVAHHLHRLARADDDVRLDPGRVDDLADRCGDARLDAQALLFLDRRLDAAPLDEILRLDDRQHLDSRRRSWPRGGRRSAARRALPRCRR